MTAAQVRRLLRHLTGRGEQRLSRDDEAVLLYGIAAGIEADRAAAELIRHNAGLARRAANRYARANHYDDAYAAALHGMVQAINRYDRSSTARWTTFAYTQCVQHVWRYVANHQDAIRVPEWAFYEARRVRRSVDAWVAANERQPTDDEMPTVCGMDAVDVRALLSTMSEPLSIDDAATGVAAIAAAEPVVDDDVSPETDAALMALDQDTRAIVVRVYGLDGRAPETVGAVAQRYRTTRRQIERIVADAMTTMRAAWE